MATCCLASLLEKGFCMRVHRLFATATAFMLSYALAFCPIAFAEHAHQHVSSEAYTNAKSAANFPNGGDILIIVPKKAGGGTDIAARGLAKLMSEDLGVKIHVENEPCHSGLVATKAIANATPNGYTMGMITVDLALYTHQDKITIAVDAFTPIITPISAPAALLVHSAAPYDTLEEFVEYVRNHPGTILMGNSGVGAIWHVATLAFEKEFGVRVKHIPFSKGSSDIAAAIAGKQINATLADPSAFKEQIDNGSLKILAIMSNERSRLFPDVPTFKELGHNLSIGAWATLVVPKGTPEKVVNILRTSARRISSTSTYDEYFLSHYIQPKYIIGDEAENLMRDDNYRFAIVLKNLLKR